jgi:hypothetical protein
MKNKKQLKETERILKRLHQNGDITAEAYTILNDRNKQLILYSVVNCGEITISKQEYEILKRDSDNLSKVSFAM